MTELSPTARWAGWVWRMQQGPGGVPAPGPVGGRPMQWIDVRDLAEFTIARCEVAEERVLAKEGGEERQLGPNGGGEGRLRGRLHVCVWPCLYMAMAMLHKGMSAHGHICTWPCLHMAMSTCLHGHVCVWPSNRCEALDAAVYNVVGPVAGLADRPTLATLLRAAAGDHSATQTNTHAQAHTGRRAQTQTNTHARATQQNALTWRAGAAAAAPGAAAEAVFVDEMAARAAGCSFMVNGLWEPARVATAAAAEQLPAAGAMGQRRQPAAFLHH